MINPKISVDCSTTKPIAPFSGTPRVQEVNPKISVDCSRTNPIAPFSGTPRVQEVHTKAEVVHPTPGQLGLGVIFNTHA